jgi:hypothetical protein
VEVNRETVQQEADPLVPARPRSGHTVREAHGAASLRGQVHPCVP